MTVIRPNSVSGINSITAQANEIKIFKSDGTQGGLMIDGANLNATSGISTVAALTVTGNVSVGGTLTYQDVTNIDSVGIITARSAIVLSDDNAIHFRGTAADDADAILRASANGGQLLINSRNDAIINIDSNNDSTDAHFAVAHGAATGSSTELFRVQEDGKVGINKTPSTYQFEVSGGSANTVASFESSDAISRILFKDNSGEAMVGAVGDALTFYTSTNATERLRIDSSGNLLLKTGEIDIQGGNKTVKTSAGFLQVGTSGSHYLSLITAGLQRLNITSGGDVCVGGHSSNYANSPLEVRGTNAGGDVAIRVTNNSTASGTQAGIIFTTTTADYTTAGIGFERGTDDALKFYVGQSSGGGGFTNATERFRITSDGDLKSGEISISAYCNTHSITGYSAFLSDNHANTFFGQNLRLGNSGGSGNHQLKVINQHGSIGGAGMLIGGNGSPYVNQLKFYTVAANQPAGTRVDDTAARMTIGSDGKFYYATTSQGPHGGFFNIDASSSGRNGMNVKGTTANYAYISSAGGSSGDHIHFSNYSNSNQETGRIKDNQSNVTYYTSSDYRLKDNIVSITDGITRVKQLNPVRHTWINNPALGTVDGWIAHELDAVCPDAVDGEKDAVREDGSIEPQAADYGRITPLLAAALKELIAKVETLEAAVTALQGS